MKKFFVPLFLVLLMSLSCYAVASAEESGGTYTMPDTVMVDEYGIASFDIILTPNDASLYNGYQFLSKPGTGVTIDSVSFSKTDITWNQPTSTIPPDLGIIAFGIFHIGTSDLNVISGTITCTVNITFTGKTPSIISFDREGTSSPSQEGIYKISYVSDGITISSYMTGPDKITILPYSLETYTVTFHPNGGTPEPDEQEVSDGEEATEPTAMTKLGFTFDGWYTDADLTDEYDFDTPVTGDLDLYAKWDPVAATTYTVTFHPNGGAPEPDEQIVTEGEKAIAPVPISKAEHKFGGWYDNDDFDGAPYSFDTPVAADLDLYAKWISSAATTHTVIFYPVGGTPAPASQIVIAGEKAILPPDMIKSGYTFGGWYTNIAYIGAPYSFDMPVTAGFELYAKWVPGTASIYDVTFDPDGGAPEPAGQKVIAGEKAAAPDAMTKSGFVFGGWYDNDGFDGVPYSFDAQVFADLELYAKWLPDSEIAHTVTFHPDGGIPEPAQQIVIEGEEATPPPEITKIGYTFIGWFSNSALTGDSFDFDTPVTGDLDLYAKWQIINYTVTFDSEGGTVVPEQTVSHGNKAAKPTEPVKEDHIFGGWYDNDDFDGAPYSFDTPVIADLELYARWIPDSDSAYIVTFHPDGGTPVPAVQIVIEEEKAVLPLTMTKYGVIFAGWYTDEDCTDEYDFDTPVTADLDLYAKWQIKTYSVTFNSIGGTGVPSQTVNHGARFAEPNKPARAGFKFGGWYDDATFKAVPYSFDTPVTADLILYARWIPEDIITYTVTFHPDGGAPTPVEQTVIEGEKAVLPAAMIKAGFTFGGWYDNPALTGSAYNFNTPVTADLDLYAKWNSSIVGPGGGGTTYIITFNSNGGSDVGSKTVLSGNKVSKPADPTKEGYSFAAWYTNVDLTAEYNFDSPVFNNFTLYAKWEVSEISDKRPPVSAKVKSLLETETHIRYIYGYPNAPVRPNGSITRAEVAMIFYRLLLDPDKDDEVDNIIRDVPEGVWYSQAVKYLAEIGIINGYEDGTFKPNQPITRAEFAKIAASFDDISSGADNPFSDLSDSHWAYSYIISCFMKGWINGYPSGDFKPDNNITRAEAIKIVNFMLGRGIRLEDIPAGVIGYTDLTRSHWAYNEIIEASMKHEYERDEDNWEIWTDYNN